MARKPPDPSGAGHSPEAGSSARAALGSEASGQRGNSMSARAGHSPEAGSSARAALASEASGQRGHPMRARAGHSPEAGSSARAGPVKAPSLALAALALGTPAHAGNGSGAERLKEIARLLDAAVAELEADGPATDGVRETTHAARDAAGTLRLLRAYERISSPALQRALTTLAEEIAGK